MSNRRVFYACRQIGFARDGTSTFIEAHGVQSIGITTNFNLETVFEQGQLEVYQLIEQVPEIEVTMTKVLDGYAMLYHLATNGATDGTLIGRSNMKTTVGMSVFSDTSSSASGTPIAEVSMSGLTMSSWTLTVPVDGNITEDMTLVGNNKVWRDDETLANGVFTGRFNNADSPMVSAQRRWDVILVPIASGVGGAPATGADVNGANTGWVSVFPKDIPGINADGTVPVDTDGTFKVPIQSITVTADLGRESIFEIGRKAPYWRFVSWPVQVRTDIEILSRKWDNITATEAGGNNGGGAGENTAYQTIKIRLKDGTYVQLGTRNRLTTSAIAGGDAGAGGSNVTQRYSYVGYNDLLVQHPQDPSAL